MSHIKGEKKKYCIHSKYILPCTCEGSHDVSAIHSQGNAGVSPC